MENRCCFKKKQEQKGVCYSYNKLFVSMDFFNTKIRKYQLLSGTIDKHICTFCKSLTNVNKHNNRIGHSLK